MKTPVIYDTIMNGDREERVVNQEATLAAREKQKLIKERFRSWVFTDPDRTERLVRLYNDTYNNLRPRLFDGSHLDFPGMNQTIRLRPHQKDAVWRGMSAGNTLLAHAVGAGKTFTMAATGMKMKQAGLIKKPMYVVPNHLLEQFAREFMQLYPNARLLVAAKEDLTRDRRKHLTAKIASGEWDGIIVTHSSFERIGMSREYQEQFLTGADRRNTTSCSRRRERDADPAPPQPHQDHREAEGRTRRAPEGPARRGQEGRRAGVRRAGRRSPLHRRGPVLQEPGNADQDGARRRHPDRRQRARLRPLHEGPLPARAASRPRRHLRHRHADQQHDGRDVHDAALPRPRGAARAAASTISTPGRPRSAKSSTRWKSPRTARRLRPRSRFARFTNLPELQQMFRAFADVQTAEMLDLPRPRLESGKPIVVACPMSEEQHALQQELVARYERLRSQKVDPREDNALAITTDGRKLATRRPDALRRRRRTSPARRSTRWWRTSRPSGTGRPPTRGTQMIFCDMGVHPTPWGYSAYDEVIRKLVARGIPREQIAAIGDADSDAKKQALFEKVRSGQVRVLLGSTQKMGTGTNVQKRLVALHHLDAPWKPAEVEQREGRILRQGNENEEVAIYRYVTEGSFDAYMWQALETKARFIAQVMTGDNAARRAEDIGGQELSYAEVKAIASGNPAVLTLAEADAELQRLTILKKNHADEQYLARRSVRDLPGTIASLSERLSNLTADQATATAHADDPITIGEPHFLPRGRTDILGRPAGLLAADTSARRAASPSASIAACASAWSCIRNSPPTCTWKGRPRASPCSRGSTTDRVPS